MKTKIFLIVLVSLFLISCENSPESPFSPEVPKKPAQIDLANRQMNFYPNVEPPYAYPYATEAEWRISGNLYNSGELPAKNIKIRSRIYDSSWNILWEGEYLFINPSTNTSYLDANESQGFTASWPGLPITIFYELDENGKPVGTGPWDAGNTNYQGITITWE